MEMGKNQKDKLIDSRVSYAQCRKAITALEKHVKKVEKKKEETELLPGKEENVWLVLSVKNLTHEKKLKPFRIPLAHPIVDPRADPICLVSKDPQREYKDLLESHNIKFINRVVGVEKLKGKFKPFEARRMLLKENGLFLADERVVPLLPKLLGKIFFKAKKQPIPVSLTKKDLKKELEEAVSSTYMHLNQGSCSSVKVGTISQSPTHILENLKSALPEIVKRISGGWDNIQSLYIKTSSSISLPIWSCDLEEGEDGRWKKLKEERMKEMESSGEMNLQAEVDDRAGTKNGRKRVDLKEDRSSSKKAKMAVELKKKSSSEEASAKHKSVSRQAKSLEEMESEERIQHNGEEKSKTKNKRTGITSRSAEIAVVQPSAKSGASSKSKAAAPSSTSPDQKSEKVTSRGPSMQTKSTLSKEEVKQKKRNLQEGLEKKKKKLAKSRIGGSIKENVIGKKSKSRI